MKHGAAPRHKTMYGDAGMFLRIPNTALHREESSSPGGAGMLLRIPNTALHREESSSPSRQDI
jgi:hypothetical protein